MIPVGNLRAYQPMHISVLHIHGKVTVYTLISKIRKSEPTVSDNPLVSDYCITRVYSETWARNLGTTEQLISICKVEIKSKQKAPKNISYNVTVIRFVINYSA